MKKWTYLVAAGMLLGAAPVFTGCIDNDEPEGITILRGAKAELLKAKAAVEAAKVAQIQAEAALLEAQAKYQEALAVTEAANAKIQEAIAKQEEAKAALLETQNEQAKQELQAAIAELEHQKEMWEIEKNNALTAAEQAAKMWELSYKQAEVEYEKALVELESKKTTLTNEQLLILNQYISDVKTAKSKLTQAQKDLKDAERTMKKAADLVEEREADKAYWQYELAKTLKLEQYALEGAQAAKDRAEEELANMPKEATELGKKLEDTSAELDALNKSYMDAYLKGAEERYAINNEYAAWQKEYQEYFDNTLTLLRTIPEFTFPEDVKNEALPFAWEYIKSVEYPELTYSLTTPSNLEGRISELTYLLDRLKSWTRDDNDNAWTSQRIAEWKQENEELKAAIEADKKVWKEAVDAYYRTPADAVIDLTKFTGYTAFAEALPNFNKAVEENEAAWEAIQKAEYTYYKVQNTYYTNIENLGTVKSEATDNLNSSLNDKLDEFTTAQQELYKAYEKLFQDLQNGVEGVTQEDVDEAWQAYMDADPWNKWNEYYNEEYSKIEANYYEGVKKEKEAWNKAANDYKTAIETYNAKRTALDTQANTITPLYATFLNSASATEWSYCAIFNTVDFMSLADMYYLWERSAYITTKNVESTNEWETSTNIIYYRDNNGTYEVEIGDATQVDKYTLRRLIAMQSNTIFGTSLYYTNEYGDPDSRLLDLTYDDVKAAIEASSEEPLYGDAYIAACGSFGKMGNVFANEARIEFAEAWIADKNSSVNKLITAVTTAINSLETEYTTVKENAEAEEKELMEELTALELKYEQTYEAADELRAKTELLIDLLESIENACYNYILNGYEFWTTDMIATEIENLNELIRGLDLEIEDQKHAVDTAQRNLEAYNDEQLSALEIATENWEDAVIDVENANEEYKAALDLLNKIIEKMSLESAAEETPAE